MYLEKQTEMIRQLGPFERAKTNIEKFVWNFMIFYTTVQIAKVWTTLDAEEDPDKASLSLAAAEVTMRGVFELVLDRDNGVWN